LPLNKFSPFPNFLIGTAKVGILILFRKEYFNVKC
jgi:hypothetical protein